MNPPIDELDASQTLARSAATVRQRRAAEVEDLQLIAHWAILHGADPRKGPNGTRAWNGQDRLIDIGGDGTPMVQELCVEELAIARETHTISCQKAMADVLDLQFRLPRIWGQVVDLAAEVWVARRVATLTRSLDQTAAAVVDAALADCIASESPSRVFTIAQAKVIEADPAGHAAKLEAERRRRYVSLSRCDEFGLRHVIARISAGDAVWIDAMVDRVADLLATRQPLAVPDRPGKTRDELRAEAFGWLARPAELLQLLLEAQQPTLFDPDAEASRATAFPEDLLDALRRVDPTKLRPPTVLYVHLHQAALAGVCTGVARCEGIGPLLLTQLTELLAHAHVDVKPVIDLNDHVSVNAYEHPEALRERVRLASPGDCFPHATGLGRKVDFDHPTPYDDHGPPGQTGTHNSGPLTRRHHRAKTHLGYKVRQTGPGEYVWRTPHGHHRLVDHQGTHHLAPDVADGLLSDDPSTRHSRAEREGRTRPASGR